MMKLPTLLTNVPAMRRRTAGGSPRRMRIGFVATATRGLDQTPGRRPKRACHDVAMARACLALSFSALLLGACATARNYPDPAGPRFAGGFAGQAQPAAIRVVSFNIKYGRDVTGAAWL